MLFKDEYYKATESGKLYFAGTSYKPVNGQLLHLIGVKQEDGNIHVVLEYHELSLEKGLPVEVKFDQVLDPIKFEKFINKIAMKIQSHDKNNKLVEFYYPKRVVKDTQNKFPTDIRRAIQHIYMTVAARRGSSVAEEYTTEIIEAVLKGDTTVKEAMRLKEKFSLK